MPSDLPIFFDDLSLERLVLGPPGTFRAHRKRALWRFRWRMSHPRDHWPGFVAAWWSWQVEGFAAITSATVGATKAFEGAVVALEEFGASYRRHEEADRAG